MKVLLLSLIFSSSMIFVCCERCPIFWGASDCPKNHTCNIGGQCLNLENKITTNCDKVECEQDFNCVQGRCWPIQGIPCNRNTFVDKDTANAMTSDCGLRGKCLNGHCRIDLCWNVVCDENEFCRDGKCYKITDSFCWNSHSCGNKHKCVSNKCKYIEEFTREKNNCDPGMIFKNGQCMMQENCVNIACEQSEVCIDGTCSSLLGTKCELNGDCNEPLICKQGICVEDLECLNKCQYNEICKEGICAPIQGSICEGSCSEGYQCINGICEKDQCFAKVCQITERCDNGMCVRVEGTFCQHAAKDCGPLFKCESGICKDTIKDMMIQ